MRGCLGRNVVGDEIVLWEAGWKHSSRYELLPVLTNDDVYEAQIVFHKSWIGKCIVYLSILHLLVERRFDVIEILAANIVVVPDSIATEYDEVGRICRIFPCVETLSHHVFQILIRVAG